MLEPILETIYKSVGQRRACKVKLFNEFDERIIHPYGACKVGVSPLVIVCWQTEGVSRTGALPGYRNLKLKNIEKAEMLEQVFLVQKDFDPADRLYQKWMFKI